MSNPSTDSAAKMDALIVAFKSNHLALQSPETPQQELAALLDNCLEVTKTILLALVHTANQGKDQKQAEHAIFTLSATLVPYLCQVLDRCLGEHDWLYRLGAAKALRLVNLSDKGTARALDRALPYLVDTLIAETQSLVKQEVVRTLTAIGRYDRRIIDALAYLTIQDKDKHLRMYASHALKQFSNNAVFDMLKALCDASVPLENKRNFAEGLTNALVELDIVRQFFQFDAQAKADLEALKVVLQKEKEEGS